MVRRYMLKVSKSWKCKAMILKDQFLLEDKGLLRMSNHQQSSNGALCKIRVCENHRVFHDRRFELIPVHEKTDSSILT